MSFDIYVKAKLEGVDQYVTLSDRLTPTYNLSKLIAMSTGWKISQREFNGTTEEIGKMLETGIQNLQNEPEKFRQYEAPNGWGTIEDALIFFNKLLVDCKEFPYGRIYVG